MAIQAVAGKKILLVSGLGHTDLSGKVPRPGLLVLRQALRLAGHDAEVMNFSTSHMDQFFPPDIAAKLANIYTRTVHPLVIEGKSPLRAFWKIPRFALDMRALKRTARELSEIEGRVFQGIADDIARKIKEENFDAIGFSLFMGSSTTGSISIANILREKRPDLPIIFGGPQTSLFAETIYRETQAPTALVIGEGESAITQIANILSSLRAGSTDALRNIPNVVFRAENGQIVATTRKRLSLEEWVNISAIPYEEGDFEGLLRYAFVETSRGCAYQCHFCPQPVLSGTRRYLKPGAAVVDEMEGLYARLGITHFEFVGSSTPPSQAEEIAKELLSRGLGDRFKWVLFMRGKDDGGGTAFAEKMRTIKRTGGECLFFGVEAAENETLALMGKKSTVEETEVAMLAAKEAGIATIGSFIYPYPGMPENEADLIINFLRRTQPLSAPVQPLGLFPGTYAFTHAEEIGCRLLYPEQEVLSYMLRYPLILSLPTRFWPPFPYTIDGRAFGEYIRAVNALQKEIGRLGILTGFSHSHYLIAQVLGLTPAEFSERMFYCSLTGDPAETRRLIGGFNAVPKKG